MEGNPQPHRGPGTKNGAGQGPSPNKQSKGAPAQEAAEPSRLRRELFSWIRALAVALVIALFLTQVVFINAQVPSESMESTIQAGDRLLGFRPAYLFGEPQRGDIIIFRFPDDESQLFIKRIIGLPGETVEIRAGFVYINGSQTPLPEPYLTGPAPMEDWGPYHVPQDGYFVMGDNRANSQDARYWLNTFVMRDKILGKALVRIFPGISALK